MDTQTIQRRRWVILGVVVVALLAIVIDNTVLNVALKTIASPASKGGIDASQSELEWAINSYTLVFAGLLFTFGVIGDRIGRKRVLMIGLLLFGLGSLFSAYSHSPDQLIAARAVMGLGGAAVMPQTLSIIANVFEPAERAKAIGIWTAAVGIGVAIGPVLGGLLLTHFWWGSVFLINVPVTAVGAAAALILVPESRNPAPGKIDYLGVLGSVIGLVLLVYGIVQGGDGVGWTSLGVLGPVVGGLVVLGLFAWHESRIEHPSLDVRLFKHRSLSASVGSIALLFFGMGGVYFFSSFYLQNVRGYSPLETGLLAIPFAVGQFVASPRSASLVSRYGPRPVVFGGMLANAVAIAGWVFLTGSSPIWIVAVLFVIQGAGLGVTIPTATSTVMESLPRERAGAGSALTNTARQVAVALSVAVLGSILSSAYRDALNPTLAHLPEAARNAAGSSITATQAVAAQLGQHGQFLLAPANTAFVDAMRITTGVAAVLSVIGCLAVLRWMPARERPSIDELVAAEVEAAERDLAAMGQERTELSPAVTVPVPRGTVRVQHAPDSESERRRGSRYARIAQPRRQRRATRGHRRGPRHRAAPGPAGPERPGGPRPRRRAVLGWDCAVDDGPRPPARTRTAPPAPASGRPGRRRPRRRRAAGRHRPRARGARAANGPSRRYSTPRSRRSARSASRACAARTWPPAPGSARRRCTAAGRARKTCSSPRSPRCATRCRSRAAPRPART